VEIGDNIELEETEAELSSPRSRNATGSRRKNGKNGSGSRGRNGKRNGNEAGNGRALADEDVSPLAPGGRIREIDLRRLLGAMREMKDGDFGVRVPLSENPLLAEIADTFNGIAKLNESLADEMVRVSTTIGREGQMTERASLGPVTGGWRTTVNSINSLITDLVSPTSEVARVLTAVA
jgi:hypothetical protein